MTPGVTPCPVCGREDAACIRTTVRGDKPTAVFRCADCDLDFLQTWQDRAWASAFYAQDDYVFQPNVTRPELKFDEYALRLERMRPFLCPSTKLLDVGAGNGRMLDLVRPHVGEVHATEITPSHVRSLRSRGYHVIDQPLEDILPDGRYDVICMFAVLEHVPNVGGFLEHLKLFLAPGASVFIEVPDLHDPLASYYDVPAYRDFYYRDYHLYYFTKVSLARLLDGHGYGGEFTHLMQASLSNHFHWMHTGRGQANTNEMVSVTLPVGLLADRLPQGGLLSGALDRLDTAYRDALTTAGVGDLLACRAWLK